MVIALKKNSFQQFSGIINHPLMTFEEKSVDDLIGPAVMARIKRCGSMLSQAIYREALIFLQKRSHRSSAIKDRTMQIIYAC
ncbi:hypothetical protein CEXT_127171 [Caerostris extrusa]|uniref:Uncharacterized protein n=1 Tax=Caerostris extrusa TaxID=172846 RepID=A0AAV4TY03_CAEEX|nr:hypothetical protein CEXT_127171 [Caerostris extrusa]